MRSAKPDSRRLDRRSHVATTCRPITCRRPVRYAAPAYYYGPPVRYYEPAPYYLSPPLYWGPSVCAGGGGRHGFARFCF